MAKAEAVRMESMDNSRKRADQQEMVYKVLHDTGRTNPPGRSNGHSGQIGRQKGTSNCSSFID